MDELSPKTATFQDLFFEPLKEGSVIGAFFFATDNGPELKRFQAEVLKPLGKISEVLSNKYLKVIQPNIGDV